MPTYDYQCQGCGHAFEKFQSMSSRVLRKCPECGEPRLERLIGRGAGIIFKGDGFYETDYRRKSDGAAKSDKPADKGEAKAGDKATGAKSDGAKKSGDNKSD